MLITDQISDHHHHYDYDDGVTEKKREEMKSKTVVSTRLSNNNNNNLFIYFCYLKKTYLQFLNTKREREKEQILVFNYFKK